MLAGASGWAGDQALEALSVAPFAVGRMTWHPILSAVEVEPAHWVMIDSLDREYCDIQLRRTPDELRYRAEYRFWSPISRLRRHQSTRTCP